MKKNLKNQSGKRGGARPGAGRPKGSSDRPKLRDNLTQEEKDMIITKVLEKAREGDTRMLQFLAEQLFGKAPASIELDGKLELAPVLVKFLSKE